MPSQLVSQLALLAVFFLGTALVLAIWLLVEESSFMKRRMVKKRLMFMSSGEWHGQEKIVLYREKLLADASFLVRLSFTLPGRQTLERMIVAAGLAINPLLFILVSLALLPIGWLAGMLFLKNATFALFAAGLAGLLPFLALRMKVQRQQEKFLEQFPEALDLFARALRAGNALTAGISMISEEMSSPLKDEFGAMFDEINFGLSVKEALLNLCERVPLSDVKFFAVATVIQGETGGNIAEVMNNISRIIRGRVRFKRQVKTLTAEGRMSAVILLGLPVTMFGYLYVVNFDYISLLWVEPMGRYLLGTGIVLMLAGAGVIKRMVNIEG